MSPRALGAWDYDLHARRRILPLLRERVEDMRKPPKKLRYARKVYDLLKLGE